MKNESGKRPETFDKEKIIKALHRHIPRLKDFKSILFSSKLYLKIKNLPSLINLNVGLPFLPFLLLGLILPKK